MSVLDSVQNELNTARKNRESEKITLLSTLLSAIKKEGKDKREDITSDGDAIQVVKRFIKNAEEVKEILINNNRDATKTIEEIEIYHNFLPKQLSEEEIRNIVKEEVEKLNDKSMKSMGIIMKVFKEKYEGCFDGKLTSSIVKEMLG